MGKDIKPAQLMIPVYINEKIVLDMLAIMEDGFSTVSQVNYSEHKAREATQTGQMELSTSVPLLSKLLKIDLKGGISHSGSNSEEENTAKEKVHTNVSLLSKFRDFLIDKKILHTDFNIAQMQVGDYVEMEGVLQKNPLIDYMDTLIDIFHMASIFSEKPQLGNRTQAKKQTREESEMLRQIKAFTEELKHSGTIDFILSDRKGTAVLSAQEQYLANDNVSEILGGHFKVLGKVIAICRDDSESIDLLRKTALSVLPEMTLSEMLLWFKNEELSEYNLPELKTTITGPAVIVIPVAIYA
ncbi:MAG TPA: hypothetical protein DF613_08155 [Lachnospiraceae bacterium]|nr:hypothetical protein [Lachnospiraceae bacterium]